jgi:hypothetical protein
VSDNVSTATDSAKSAVSAEKNENQESLSEQTVSNGRRQKFKTAKDNLLTRVRNWFSKVSCIFRRVTSIPRNTI